ncbi:MAG: DUF4861 family protein [Prevotella sp.]|nr:DUF4861 family protein [Prevotella sp.]
MGIFVYIKRCFLWVLLSAGCLMTAQAQQKLVVSNPTDMQRHEVIEVSDVSVVDSQLIIRDAFGIQQPWQRTHDGKVLLYVSVRPHGEAVYTLEKADGRWQMAGGVMTPRVFGKYYPERADDISFENDRIGFRIYGPATQRRGEKAFGYDLWVKHSSELLVDSLYRLEFSLHPEIAELRKQGRLREADSLTTVTSYHLDHGAGMDGYGVGPTLGCGTPALMVDGSLCFPWCYEHYEILDNGPLRFTVRLDFGEKDVHGQKIREHRLLTLDRGSNFCQMTVWYDGIRKPVSLAAGFAVRTADTTSVVLGKNYIHYADPTVDPQRHNSQIYVAAIFPEGVDETCKLMFDQPIGANAGHALGVVRDYVGQPYTYYAGMGWSDFDVRSQEEWNCRVSYFMRALSAPLHIRKE